MTREIEIERTARVLKQAEPGHAPRPTVPARPSSDGAIAVAVICGIVAFVAILAAFAGR